MIDVRRVGKVIYVIFDDGWALRSHLAMSGIWSSKDDPWSYDYVEMKRDPTDETHVRVILHTDHGDMLYHDQRLFGRMNVVKMDWHDVPGIGYEWVETSRGVFKAITIDELVKIAAKYDGNVRNFLCDQSIVPGIGNIYSAEVLWYAGIHPEKQCSSLSFAELMHLLIFSSLCLAVAISTNLDYSNLSVYRRNYDTFGHAISTVKIDKRTVYFCKTCQSL